MKIFISHSSKDKHLAISLSSFLESVAPSVEVFCSSQSGSIRVGQNFVKSITEALKNCNVFIPLLSPNYYTSRFCMIELGFAYSLLVQNSNNDVSSNIFPIAIPPVKKEAGTAQAVTEGLCREMLRICLHFGEKIWSYRTTPTSKIRDFCHLYIVV